MGDGGWVPHDEIGRGDLTSRFRNRNSKQHDKSHGPHGRSSQSKGRPNIKFVGKVCCDITRNHRHDIRSYRKQLCSLGRVAQVPQDGRQKEGDGAGARDDGHP